MGPLGTSFSSFSSVRQNDFLPSNCTLGEASLPPSSVASFTQSESRPQQHHYIHSCSSKGVQILEMVDISSHGEREFLPGTIPSHPDQGHQPVWLGHPFALSGDPGLLVTNQPPQQHKLAGTESHTLGVTSFQTSTVGSPCAVVNGQRHFQGTRELPRGYTFQNADEGSRGAGPVGREAPPITTGWFGCQHAPQTNCCSGNCSAWGWNRIPLPSSEGL